MESSPPQSICSSGKLTAKLDLFVLWEGRKRYIGHTEEFILLDTNFIEMNAKLEIKILLNSLHQDVKMSKC